MLATPKAQAAASCEGRKDRPCAIVVAARADPMGQVQTIVAPITHSPPTDMSMSLEISARACPTLGLDEGRHWLRLDELNDAVRRDGANSEGIDPNQRTIPKTSLFFQKERSRLERRTQWTRIG